MSKRKASIIKSYKNIKKKYGSIGIAIIVLLIIATLLFSLLFWKKMIKSGVSAAQKSFRDKLTETRNNSHEEYKDKGYQDGYDKYISRDDITIDLGEIKEISKLEVLKVVEDSFSVESEELKKKGIYTWIKFRGVGLFTVNLKASEFIVDEQSHYVLVRVPKPEMTEFSLVNADTERMLYADYSWNVPISFLNINKWTFMDGSYKDGVEIVTAQTEAAYHVIKESILENQRYYTSAQSAAKQQIENMIKILNDNKEMSDLIVDVEFYDSSKSGNNDSESVSNKKDQNEPTHFLVSDTDSTPKEDLFPVNEEKVVDYLARHVGESIQYYTIMDESDAYEGEGDLKSVDYTEACFFIPEKLIEIAEQNGFVLDGSKNAGLLKGLPCVYDVEIREN